MARYRTDGEPAHSTAFRLLMILGISTLACQGLLPATPGSPTPPEYLCDNNAYPLHENEVMSNIFVINRPDQSRNCAFVISYTVEAGRSVGLVILGTRAQLDLETPSGLEIQQQAYIPPPNTSITLSWNEFAVTLTSITGEQIVVETTINPNLVPTPPPTPPWYDFHTFPTPNSSN